MSYTPFDAIQIGIASPEMILSWSSGEVKKPHKIDSGKCIKCGSCKAACRFDAIFIK